MWWGVNLVSIWLFAEIQFLKGSESSWRFNLFYPPPKIPTLSVFFSFITLPILVIMRSSLRPRCQNAASSSSDSRFEVRGFYMKTSSPCHRLRQCFRLGGRSALMTYATKCRSELHEYSFLQIWWMYLVPLRKEGWINRVSAAENRAIIYSNSLPGRLRQIRVWRLSSAVGPPWISYYESMNDTY